MQEILRGKKTIVLFDSDLVLESPIIIKTIKESLIQNYLYQQTQTYFAQIPEGFEDIASQELKQLGATKTIIQFRGIEFTAAPETLYAINYKARLISRILAPLVSFKCRDRNDIYHAGKSIKLPNLMSASQTFGIFANVSHNPRLTHSNFASLCLKDGIVDLFRSTVGERPNIDKKFPDIWINLHIHGEQGTISLDTGGGALHRRGYRKRTVTAPIQENLAAAMVSLSNWQGDMPLYDPMCGSGTILCEALMKQANIPAGFLKKKFGFFYLPDFDQSLWHNVKRKIDTHITPIQHGLISGSDKDGKAIRDATKNIQTLPGGENIILRKIDYNHIPKLENQMILCNPPYGIRMGQNEDLDAFYKSFGDFLKQRCKGSTAFIFFGNRDMLKKIGLRSSMKKHMRNAGLDGRVARFDIY